MSQLVFHDVKSNAVMAADGSQEVAKDAVHVAAIDTCNLIKGKPESGACSVCQSAVSVWAPDLSQSL